MPLILDDLLPCCAAAETAADRYETEAREAVRRLIAPEGKVDAKLLEREQFAAHGFAWIATYVSATNEDIQLLSGQTDRIITKDETWLGELSAALRGRLDR